MGFARQPQHDAGFVPRLWTPDESDVDDGLIQDGVAGAIEPSSDVTPIVSAELRLSEFFEMWYLPIVLIMNNRKPGTIKAYREAIAYWVRFTGDPPLRRLCATAEGELACVKFVTGLRGEAETKRGPRSLGKAITKHTVAKHVIAVNAVLRRAGPTTDRRLPGKKLIAEVPYMAAAKPRSTPKPPIEINLARTVHAASTLMRTPRRIAAPARFWETLTGALYYIGMRITTTSCLRPEWRVLKGTEHWFRIPGEVVKREKPLEKYIRPELAQMFDRLPPAADGSYFGKHRLDYLRDRHERLQTLAGVRKHFGFHAWRRTHAVQMALVGAKAGLKAAQFALDHDDDETTSDHYVDIQRELIDKLPPLALPRDDDKQLNLF